ncbi:MAG: multicomponent Na+:H+ antiporter subunit MnhC [Rhodobacteraceae bacterium HLUCCA12]|nr:MAG: multicomponent Na+:H+ antiporter subunit MnhC [Rhodobacteraceae bacterium HLUCCA12]
MTPFAVTGALLVALGLYGLIAGRALLRRIIAFNVMGSGVFLMLGALGWHEGRADPVPQALIITGIVVALSGSALAVGLVVALARATGRQHLRDDVG